MYTHYKLMLEKSWQILEDDDKEGLVQFACDNPKFISHYIFRDCAISRAKKCVIAMIKGELGKTAFDLYTEEAHKNPATPTPLAYVAAHMPEYPDLIDLLLQRGPIEHVNLHHPDLLQAYVGEFDGPVLEQLLVSMSTSESLRTLWTPGNSLYKLVIFLCQCQVKPSLDSARLLVPYTNEIDKIALAFIKYGRLVPLAALLLVAGEKVTGSRIRQNVTNMVDALNSKADLSLEEARCNLMLLDALKLLDIFERAGDDLSFYCSSVRMNVNPVQVLTEVASLLKKAGFLLQPVDLDLRECFREHLQLRNPNLFKLSDHPTPNDGLFSLSSHTQAQDFGSILKKYPNVCDCQFVHRLNSGSLLKLTPSGSQARLFGTAAGPLEKGLSSISFRYLVYTALLKTKRAKVLSTLKHVL